MYQAEIFLWPIIVAILILFLFQSLTFRITILHRLTLSIEYFPITLILYNFKLKKRSRKKLMRQTKRFLFFLSPMIKAARFLLSRSDAKIFDLSLLSSDQSEPHSYYLSRELSDISKIHLCTLMFALTRSTENVNFQSNENSEKSFDLEITTRFYNLTLAFFAFIFYCINKLGRNKRIV